MVYFFVSTSDKILNVRLKNQWNDIMQTLFLNIAKLKRKQNNWNDILHLLAVYHSQINNSVQTMYELNEA